jgi:excinuclease ABC subunit C
MIPSHIKIKNGELPDAPGVYFHYDHAGKLLYIGKATSLKKRVGSYFTKAHDRRIAELVSQISRIEYIQTPTVIEALVLEANQIKAHRPPFNIMLLDDKTFLYLCITNEEFPKPVFMRGLDLERLGIQPFTRFLSFKARKKFLAVYGPYTSGRSLRTALDILRRAIPWSTCESPSVTGSVRPCFDAQIGKCPGVCSGAISKKDYRKTIKKLMLFFEGKKERIIASIRKDMDKAAKQERFEDAKELRDQLFSLEHIHDVALITREEPTYQLETPQGRPENFINALGRVEAYDIANISGTSNVAAMVVFENGKANKDEYRKFRIKTFEGTNDVGAMEEVMRRRLARAHSPSGSPPQSGGVRGGQDRPRGGESWPLPDIMIIDGGEGQVNRVNEIIAEAGLTIPIIGIAKGFDRKQDRLVYDESNPELRRVAEAFKEVFQKARDEAHRFAGAYHRILRSRRSGIPQRKKPRRVE